MFINKKEGPSRSPCPSGGPAHSMNIILGVIWRIILNDPIDVREVKTPLRDISAQKNARFSLCEFKISGSPLLLLLLAMDILDWDVHVI